MKIAHVPEAWKKVLLLPLAKLLFESSKRDVDNAWNQAIALIREYCPQTELEFRLIVRVTILNIQASEATALASEPGITVSQAIRLQTNAVTMFKAADKAEARFRQLESARTQRAKTAAPEPAPSPATEPQPEAPPTETVPQAAKDEARAISEYARKNNVTYAEAWTIHQRAKKAARTQPQPASA